MSKKYLTDLEIAQSVTPRPIVEIAEKLGLNVDTLDLYGKHIAKVSRDIWDSVESRPDGNLVLVTAMTPTPAGEGKSTTTVGLGDALTRLGKKAVIAIREPSLGPCFGTKGGAAGGGYAQVIPMEQINLHFTGDIHAVTYAHNLLTSMLFNHLHQGNERRIDARRVQWQHVIDLNARHLRNIVAALGGQANGFPMETGFSISTASEIMAILCLARDIADLKERLGRIYVGDDLDNHFVFARELHAPGAMAALLKDAIRPNLVQTLEATPAFIHGGPFANIAHGCNSLQATRLALKLGDYVVTEAGFGSDLGAEKFFDIKCRVGNLKPAAVVVVATIRALRYHGGAKDYGKPDVEAVRAGLANLGRHIENVRSFGVPLVVAVNTFVTDASEEHDVVNAYCRDLGVPVCRSEVWEHGGRGGEELASKVIELVEGGTANLRFQYDLEQSFEEKIEALATKIYRADEVVYTSAVKAKFRKFTKHGFGNLPICIAKTQSSFSANPRLLGAPTGFEFPVQDARLSAGAGFVVVLAGDIMTMPGLGKVPAANNIDLTDDGTVVGLF